MADVDLSIVILSWNTRELTSACLDALAADTTELTREIIVVDNGSHDGSADHIAEHYPDVVLIRNADNKLYAEGNNQGARAARGKWLCTLNSDTEVRPGALDKLVRFLETHPDYGAVSPKLVNPDGSVQPACARFPGLLSPLAESTRLGATLPPLKARFSHDRMVEFDHTTSRDVDQPPGAVMMFDREEFLAYGGLDQNLSLYYNDVDMCMRLWADGRRIRFLADAEVMHHQGASTGLIDKNENDLWLKNRETFYTKHHGRLGKACIRGVLGLWAAEYAAGVALSPRRSLGDKRAELIKLGKHLRGALD